MITRTQVHRFTVLSVLLLFFSMFVCGPALSADPTPAATAGAAKAGTTTGAGITAGVSSGTIALGAVAAAVAAGVIASGGGGGGGGSAGGSNPEADMASLETANAAAAADLNQLAQVLGVSSLENLGAALTELTETQLNDLKTQLALNGTLDDWLDALNAVTPADFGTLATSHSTLTSIRHFLTALHNSNPAAYNALRGLLRGMTAEQYALLKEFFGSLTMTADELKALLKLAKGLKGDWEATRLAMLTAIHHGYNFTFTHTHLGNGRWTTTTHFHPKN